MTADHSSDHTLGAASRVTAQLCTPARLYWCGVECGTWYMVHGIRYMIATRYIVHGTGYMIHGTRYMVGSTRSERVFPALVPAVSRVLTSALRTSLICQANFTSNTG